MSRWLTEQLAQRQSNNWWCLRGRKEAVKTEKERNRNSGVTVVILNPPMSSFLHRWKKSWGEVTLFVLPCNRPHTMHINITFKQNGRRKNRRSLLSGKLSQAVCISYELHYMPLSQWMRHQFMFTATLNCFLLVPFLELRSQENSRDVNGHLIWREVEAQKTASLIFYPFKFNT